MDASERARLIGLVRRWGSLRVEVAGAEATAEQLRRELRSVERALCAVIGPRDALKVGGLVLVRDQGEQSPPGTITGLVLLADLPGPHDPPTGRDRDHPPIG